MENIKSIVIIGKLWFDKVNGNTYFSSVGIVDGEIKAVIKFAYGYSDQYVWETFRELEKNGTLEGVKHYKNGGQESLWEYCERNGIKYQYLSSNVNRRKDL